MVYYWKRLVDTLQALYVVGCLDMKGNHEIQSQ